MFLHALNKSGAISSGLDEKHVIFRERQFRTNRFPICELIFIRFYKPKISSQPCGRLGACGSETKRFHHSLWVFAQTSSLIRSIKSFFVPSTHRHTHDKESNGRIDLAHVAQRAREIKNGA